MSYVEILRHVRLALIWGAWSVAWALMLLGTVNDRRFLAWGLFVGMGAAVLVAWELIDTVARRERMSLEEMADALARAARRRDGPRGV